jgi:hypothetical protein
VLSLLEPED